MQINYAKNVKTNINLKDNKELRAAILGIVQSVKGGFELSFYGGLKMYDLGGLRINRC